MHYLGEAAEPSRADQLKKKMRKGASKGKNLSQVDSYRRRIGEKEVRKVRAHLHMD